MELCDGWFATGMVSAPWLDRKLGSVPDGQYFRNRMQKVLLFKIYRENQALQIASFSSISGLHLHKYYYSYLYEVWCGQKVFFKPMKKQERWATDIRTIMIKWLVFSGQ